MAAITDGAIERCFTPGFTERAPEVVEPVRRMLLSIEPEGYAASCEAIAAHDLRGRHSAIQAPTLIIVGDEDPSTPPDHAKYLASQIQGARIVELQAARHLLNIEQPERVARELTDHLTGGTG